MNTPDEELHRLSVAEAGRRLRDGTLTSRRLARYALDRIGALDPRVHAFVRITADRAMTEAQRADDELRQGTDRGPMHGIPYTLKDIFDVAGIPTTCHSRLRVDFLPNTDSTVQSRLAAGGAVLLGKVATHEFALGGPSFDLPFPPARNPWDTARFTGGSSSGSAAAVAAGFVRVSVGSDTSGSIRGPAALCGVVGLKPTYGLVSRFGAYPLAYSMDHSGVIGASVRDVAMMANVIAGHDPLDPSSINDAVPSFDLGSPTTLDGLRIAYARSFFSEAPETSPEVLEAVDVAVEQLARLGAEVRRVDLPEFALFNACGRVIMMAEAYSIHEDDLRHRMHDYGRYTAQRLVQGAGISSADFIAAQRLRRELIEELEETVFSDFDAMITASVLAPAPLLADFPDDWPPPSSMTASRSIPFNVTGHPALAMPTARSHSGLPLGIQIVGRFLGEATVLHIGACLESATPAFGIPRL